MSWTLSYVVLFYLAIPLLIDAGGLRARSAAARVALAGTLLISSSIFYEYSGIVPLRLNMLLAGVLLAELLAYRKGNTLPGWLTRLMMAAIPAGIALRYLIVRWRNLSVFECCRTPLQTGITAVCVFCFCYFALAPAERRNGWLTWTPLRWFGNMSYSYYLGHSLAIKCFAILAAPVLAVFPLSEAGFWAVQPLLFALSLAPCVVLFVFVEKPVLSITALAATARGFSGHRDGCGNGFENYMRFFWTTATTLAVRTRP